MKQFFILITFLVSVTFSVQSQSKRQHLKRFKVQNDSIFIDSVSITPFNFKVLDTTNVEIDTSAYNIDFPKALLVFKTKKYPKTVQVQYTSYPVFLTKTYFTFDKKLIVPTSKNKSRLYSLTSTKNKTPFKPFDGLNTAGNITRGFTIGNNQNGVSNSSLDLKISGKLSDKVTLRASIVDTNLPIQESGNTYEINEFDRIFIELFSKNWSVNAGDIYLNNNETTFLNFNKKVSGLEVNATINNKKSKVHVKASGAIVRGKYKKVNFNGIEGNQGPYQLSDFSNKYILILSGTEQIFNNGIQLQRGEDKDYTIDYNTSEITFNSTYPITADMRISAEYQYADREYTRFITYNKAAYENKNLKVSSYFYNENDLKNQPLEQDLSNEQKQILANAGNNLDAMVTPSAFETPFSEDKILYKKVLNGTEETYEYSTNENDELYSVSFSFTGESNGNYILKDVIAIGNIYEYVGENLGNYNPITSLEAPTKLQLVVLKAEYNPSTKTTIYAESAFSNNDQNLFSNLDDNQNKGLATKLGWSQVLSQKKWQLKTNLKVDYINKKFKSIERVQPIEFNRNWNVEAITGDQTLIYTDVEYSKSANNFIKYSYQNLKLNETYKGNKHSLNSLLSSKNFSTTINSSFLNNKNSVEEGSFIKNYIQTKYNLKKSWVGVVLNSEKNERKTILDNSLLAISHKYNEFQGFFGIGDSTNVYTQIGAKFRNTDSIQNNAFSGVNKAKTFYIKSTLINSKTSKLSAYVNYRTVNNTNFNNEESLNSRIAYRQQLFNNFLNVSSIYQTVSGTLPQQDYRYVKTEVGQGFYTWIDYNNNGIKELNEFEIAQFPDEAEYLRIILPTVNYLPTHQNKFTQTININAQQWNNKKGIRKMISHFSNQFFVLVDSKQQKQAKKFNLNPFDINNNKILGLNFNINNSLFFNRGKKNFSTTYNYIKSKNQSSSTIDFLSNTIKQHQLLFEHKIGSFWQFNFSGSNSNNSTESENFSNRNYVLENSSINPKLSYYYNKDMYFSVYYELKDKKNTIGDLETLKQNKLGTELNFSHKEKSLIKADFNYFKNNFTGNANSPVAYQMLEGLQPGKNYTWSLLYHKKINSFLNLNVNYIGRKSETSSVIHTGSIQLKALF
ncbi:hypothetical protein SAMN05444411_11362 [Lutibacter oricola]|uniref:Uncharacterized protein n=1 Tax=Lutibacter oricola TaxID=762486 RepID=A0A1H3G6H5_9FLAO|nr:hypothetical protein [Lutibacter oricola]SDX98876.1 hypothetical protein SAMN05444411_11362 [Lutibacter oricola]